LPDSIFNSSESGHSKKTKERIMVALERMICWAVMTKLQYNRHTARKIYAKTSPTFSKENKCFQIKDLLGTPIALLK
jgi:hypothetical protein